MSPSVLAQSQIPAGDYGAGFPFIMKLLALLLQLGPACSSSVNRVKSHVDTQVDFVIGPHAFWLADPIIANSSRLQEEAGERGQGGDSPGSLPAS